MYLVKNIANDRFKGVLFRHDGHFGSSVAPLSLQLEPMVGSRLLKIGHQTTLTAEEFLACKDVIDTHVKGNVLEVIKLVPDEPTITVNVETMAEPVVSEEPKIEEAKVELVKEEVKPIEEVKPVAVPVKVESSPKKIGKGK